MFNFNDIVCSCVSRCNGLENVCHYLKLRNYLERKTENINKNKIPNGQQNISVRTRKTLRSHYSTTCFCYPFEPQATNKYIIE